MRINSYRSVLSLVLILIVSACSTATESSPEEPEEPLESIVQYRVNLSDDLTGRATYYHGNGITTSQPVQGNWESVSYTVQHGTEMSIHLEVEFTENEMATVDIDIFVDEIREKSFSSLHENPQHESIEYTLSVVVGEDN